MISINEYLINKSTKNAHNYKYFPENKFELKDLIEERISTEGPDCDLNDIDVSKIKDMSSLFARMGNNFFTDMTFTGDISKWDVGNVTNMESMFEDSEFNGDISKWNVSNVNKMTEMFYKSPLARKKPHWYHD